ncbi:C12A2 protein, partial [Acromyrmex heyeri]
SYSQDQLTFANIKSTKQSRAKSAVSYSIEYNKMKDAENEAKMYRMERTWPLRIAMETGSRSPAFSQGKLWHDFRSKVNPHTMQPRMIKAHVSQINEVASEFMEKIRALQDLETLELPSVFEKTPNELLKWALELNTSTKAKYETMNNSTNLHDCSILEKLLHIDKITAQVMALDMLMANMYSNNMYIDMTGNVSGSLLYYTANNSEEKLRKEVMFVLRDKTSPCKKKIYFKLHDLHELFIGYTCRETNYSTSMKILLERWTMRDCAWQCNNDVVLKYEFPES